MFYSGVSCPLLRSWFEQLWTFLAKSPKFHHNIFQNLSSYLKNPVIYKCIYIALCILCSLRSIIFVLRSQVWIACINNKLYKIRRLVFIRISELSIQTGRIRTRFYLPSATEMQTHLSFSSLDPRLDWHWYFNCMIGRWTETLVGFWSHVDCSSVSSFTGCIRCRRVCCIV